MGCQVTITELESVTGKTYRVIKKRLHNLSTEPGSRSENCYDCRAVIREFAKGDEAANLTYAEVQLERQKAERRLAEAKAKKIEFQLDLLEKLLYPAEQVEKLWSKLIENFKAKLTQLPPKVALRLSHLGNQAEIEGISQDLIYEALEELSYENAGIEQLTSDLKQSEAASETHSQ